MSYVPSPTYPNCVTTWMVNGVVPERSIAIIPTPSQIIWCQEKATLGNEAVVRPAPYQGTPPSPYVAAKTYQDWLRPPWSDNHFAGGNLVYCDGHVKWRAQVSLCAGDFGLVDSTVDTASGGIDCGSSANAGQSYATAAF